MQIYYQICLILIFCVTAGFSVSLERDLTITWGQKQALDKFKELVGRYLPQDYMREDIYLIRWLRAQNFDIQAAERMLKKSLAWRRENRIDTILEEDFSDMEEDYKYYTDGRDFQGRPVAYFDLGAYDLRQAALTGKMPRLLRYLSRYMETITSKVRTYREKEGANITQYSFVINMDGFNLIQHVCLQCVPTVVTFITNYENYWPGACDKMYLVNTPAAFEPVLQILKTAMSPLSQESLRIYGTNKVEWQKVLFEDIPRDQLPTSVGGTAHYAD